MICSLKITLKVYFSAFFICNFVTKLLQQTKIKNGDIWEECSDIKLRCDLYSIKKSLELCQFLIRTNHYVGNINSNSYKCPLKADISIITKENVEVKLIDI